MLAKFVVSVFPSHYNEDQIWASQVWEMDLSLLFPPPPPPPPTFPTITKSGSWKSQPLYLALFFKKVFLLFHTCAQNLPSLQGAP